jgi:hypothetical protein
MMSRKLKIAALSELDGLIWQEIMLKHEGQPMETFSGYDEDTDPGTELLAPFPYDEMYKYWLMARVDEQNLETTKYENDRTLFNGSYEMFHDFWRRTHMPKTTVRELRI